MTETTAQRVEETLKKSLRQKMNKTPVPPGNMPFHIYLLGKDRMALFSFIHSLNTTFGISIFEPVAWAISKESIKIAEKRAAGNRISTDAQRVIQEIMDDLIAGNTAAPDKSSEIEKIRAVCQSGSMKTVSLSLVDVYLVDQAEKLYLFDLKTAKPNKGNFIDFKRMLLEWTAVTLADNPSADVNTLIAIPYNPDAPKPYSQWQMRGMLDIRSEIKVAGGFWDFLGGDGTYEQLLVIFERVGLEMRENIDAYFDKYRVR